MRRNYEKKFYYLYFYYIFTKFLNLFAEREVDINKIKYDEKKDLDM